MVLVRSDLIFFPTAKLLEKQIERERARKVDEVCLSLSLFLTFT